MTNLSPAAQAVLDAYLNAPCGKPPKTWIAAALRAAADQVVPEENPPWKTKMHPWQEERFQQRQVTRRSLMAIAAELEGTNE
jgi:hypothetical protein